MNLPQSDRTRSFLQLLVHISRELNTSLDSTTVLHRVLMLSARNLGAERGSLITLDARQKPVDAAIVVGEQFHSHTLQQLQEILSSGLASRVVETRLPVLIADTSQDDRWMRRPDDAPDQSGAKSALCVPLLAQDQLVGVLPLVHPTPHFLPRRTWSSLAPLPTWQHWRSAMPSCMPRWMRLTSSTAIFSRTILTPP